jgi:peptidoglycan/LPS O-acetylase OafA/YrhL
VAVSVVAAHVMYVLVEQPAIRWSRRLRASESRS